MRVISVPALDVSGVVEFVNEYADRPREAADEQEMPYPDAADILAWPGRPPTHPHGGLVAAANATYRVFSAAPDGRALDELNRLLRSARPSPIATESGIRWTVDAPSDTLLAALGTCLLEWLMSHEQARLGTCHASKCVDVYVDASPGGRRRFCSSTCLSRHKVAAYRQRSPKKPSQGR